MTALPYLLHGTTLALAWFLIFNLAATAAIALLSPRLTARAGAASPGFWLALRLAPAALSLAFVATVFLPSYWRYEPREFVEGFDLSLTTLAALALVVVAAATSRGASAWRRAERRTAAWMRAGRPLTLPGTPMPAFVIDAEAPVMALVGVLRPRLLITRPVLDALTGEELGAAAAHELGHWRAFDNLKRLAMCAAPDLLFATAAARARAALGRRVRTRRGSRRRRHRPVALRPGVGAGQGRALDAAGHLARRADQRADRRRRHHRARASSARRRAAGRGAPSGALARARDPGGGPRRRLRPAPPPRPRRDGNPGQRSTLNLGTDDRVEGSQNVEPDPRFGSDAPTVVTAAVPPGST